MIDFTHIDGDVCIQMTQLEDQSYEVVLSEKGQGQITKDVTNSYEQAVFYYLRAIACEAACYGKSAMIESMVVDTTTIV